MKRAANVDINHAHIVNALRGRGCSVQSLAQVGKGCPDLLVGYCGDNFLLEIKRADAGPKAAALSQEQSEWHRAWRGQVCVVHDLEDLKRLFPAAFAETAGDMPEVDCFIHGKHKGARCPDCEKRLADPYPLEAAP